MKDFMDENELNDELEPIEEDITVDDELEDIEENSAIKIKKLKQQLKECETQKMAHLEDLQRAKAEFLNAKRRIEEERIQDKERAVTNQIEKLLPLCDSFQMAMSNKEAWDAVPTTWRKGIESIYTQLQSILASYNVSEVSPLGEEFDPEVHDAMANIPVTDKAQHHKIINVVQNGFIRNVNGKEILIRPARVTIGEFTEKN